MLVLGDRCLLSQTHRLRREPFMAKPVSFGRFRLSTMLLEVRKDRGGLQCARLRQIIAWSVLHAAVDSSWSYGSHIWAHVTVSNVPFRASVAAEPPYSMHSKQDHMRHVVLLPSCASAGLPGLHTCRLLGCFVSRVLGPVRLPASPTVLYSN